MKDELFGFVVTFFSSWGWQSLGKVANPVTGKVEKNLDMAKQTIDILEVLKVKTKGNLSAEEAKLLDSIVAELQLNYVDELNKKAEDKEKKEEEGGGKEEKKGDKGKNQEETA